MADQKTSKEVVAEVEPVVEFSVAELKKIRTAASGNWKQDIVAYLKAHQGSTDIEVYKATRPDKAETETEAKMKHNIASQYKYLRDDGYRDVLEDDKRYLVIEPVKEGSAIRYLSIPGQAKRAQQLKQQA